MSPRPRLVLLVGAVLAGVLGLPSASAACAGVKVSGRWSSVDLPVLADVPGVVTPQDSITSYAVAAGRPKLLYAAGGRQVFRSRDGGCSWQVAVSLDTAGSGTGAGRLDPAYVFVDVIVPNTVPGATSSTVYALAVDWTSAVTVSPPVVLAVSRDDGATWRVSEPPPAGLVPDYPRCSSGSLTAGADPQAVYLACKSIGLVEGFATLGQVRCTTSFYVSRDDGVTWTPIEPGVAAGCPVMKWTNAGLFQPRPFADPRASGWLWGMRLAFSGASWLQRLMLSTDDGRTVKDLTEVPDPSQLIPPSMDVDAPVGVPRRIALSASGAVFVSVDGGTTAQRLPIGKSVTAVFFEVGGQGLDGWIGDRWQRFDLRSGRWTPLPPVPTDAKVLSQFRSDGAVPLGLFALAAATTTTPARLMVFR